MMHSLSNNLRSLGFLNWALGIAGLATAALSQEKQETVTASDPAYTRAKETIESLTHMAKSLGLSQAHDVGRVGLVTRYPELGRARDLKSFQIFTSESTSQNKPLAWWIEVSSEGKWVYQITFRVPSAPQEFPFQSTWSSQTALEIGGKFLTGLIPGDVQSFKQSGCEFVQRTNHKYAPSIYMSASWNLSFQRFTTSGYPVWKDTIRLTIHEEYGLTGYQNECLTQIDEEHLGLPSLTEKEATILATGFAKKILATAPAVRHHFGQFTLSASVGGKVMVVRPNDLLTCRDFHMLNEGSRGVLAWVIAFNLNSNSNLAPGSLLIYINAKTGELLGGSC